MSFTQRLRRTLRTPLGIVTMFAVFVLLVVAIIGPIFWQDTADRVDTTAIGRGGSAEHWFGTDALGRDIAARMIVATRLTLELTLGAVVIGGVGGFVLGTLPTVLGPRLARLVTALVNLLIAFPTLLFVLFLAIVFGVGTHGAVLAIGIGIVPTFARLIQNLAASVAGSDYVASARILGVGRFRLIVRHILPNIAEPVALFLFQAGAGILLAFSGLSFLGLGVQPPDYDWGRLLNEQLNRVYTHPESAVGPAVAIVLTGLAFNLVGEVLSQAGGRRGLRTAADRDHRATVPAPSDDPNGTAGDGTGPAPLLEVDRLRITFPGGHVAVRDVSLSVAPGEAVGIVGESGSGKSLTALAVAGLVPYPARVTARSITFDGVDPTAGARLGTSLSMVFQDPMASLNPALTIGRQLSEVAEVHLGHNRTQAMKRAVDRLRAVRIPDPEHRSGMRPSEFSGGMRQRTMIAMGLMGEPRLVIADEPTTALDVTVQAQVLALLRDVRTKSGAAVLMISHDIAVVSQVCERVMVMYAGRVVEELPTGDLVTGTAHPYTRALIGAVPDMTTDRGLPLVTIAGRPPGPGEDTPGCPFAPRCELATDRCHTDEPALERIDAARRVACWHPVITPPEARIETE
ncbi:dipeptide/oligopeptide/nickel ABC transporter permease/ATP-binding protein [Embleya scabrispora]|uniref:dipeptide/oligopeptide/nickel ABC transporter permease/ATP-binding protein n=1 Tax=Embleya scabrispora TaxID=159449 RepID=UPI000380305F|nr:dipeptide/oligopeptide/nickel ABC transporter permease/ATP-binding protein [Embleya scabrispora]MYS86727.1 ATP-binding cassette domain-containing protein [Streptomyces sp. SID5474]